MGAHEILAHLTAVFQEVFDDPALTIDEAMTAEDVGGWDSVTHILLVVAVEQAFAVKFKTAEIETLKNVGDLVRLIDRKTAGKT
jgi:acyl carrier protein